MSGDAVTQVLLIDDHVVLLEGMSALLNSDPKYRVCGTAKTCEEALQRLGDCGPDIVILDLSLADGNGLDLLKQIRVFEPKLPIIVLSMHDESLYADRAIRSGANGYIMKGESLQKVFEAIPFVLGGRIYVSEDVRLHMLGMAKPDDDAEEGNPLAVLSDRELEIFQSIGKGKTYAAIADSLKISARTVETYARRICPKLNLNGMKELREYAISYFAAR